VQHFWENMFVANETQAKHHMDTPNLQRLGIVQDTSVALPTMDQIAPNLQRLAADYSLLNRPTDTIRTLTTESSMYEKTNMSDSAGAAECKRSLADAYFKESQFKQALPIYRMLSAAHPEMADASLNLKYAKCLAMTGNTAEAKRFLQKILGTASGQQKRDIEKELADLSHK
jgi:tetratricopeptide (TPR) repeat protein